MLGDEVYNRVAGFEQILAPARAVCLTLCGNVPDTPTNIIRMRELQIRNLEIRESLASQLWIPDFARLHAPRNDAQ